MKKYTKILLIIAAVRAFASLVFIPLFGNFSAYVEIVVFVICGCGFNIICHRLRDVKDEGSTPNLLGHVISTVTFSGVVLMGYPLVLLIYSLLPTMSFKLNQFSRLPYGIDGAQVSQAVAFYILLILSVALVKSVNFKLDKKTVILGGCAFVLMGSSFQNIPSDFLFGCFIVTYLIRYGSTLVAGVYIFLYKFLTMFLDLWIYSIIGDSIVSFSASLGEIFGTFCLFGAVLLLGVYLDVRFIEKRKKMPMFSAFTIPLVILLSVIGYFTLNYTRI